MMHAPEMELQYLLFDTTDEEVGSCSFDALASVLLPKLPALVHEVEAVLGWACREFGIPATAGDDAEWDFEVQAVDEHDVPLEIFYDTDRARVSVPPGLGERVTLALTLTGSGTFGAAFREAFSEAQ